MIREPGMPRDPDVAWLLAQVPPPPAPPADLAERIAAAAAQTPQPRNFAARRGGGRPGRARRGLWLGVVAASLVAAAAAAAAWNGASFDLRRLGEAPRAIYEQIVGHRPRLHAASKPSGRAPSAALGPPATPPQLGTPSGERFAPTYRPDVGVADRRRPQRVDQRGARDRIAHEAPRAAATRDLHTGPRRVGRLRELRQDHLEAKRQERLEARAAAEAVKPENVVEPLHRDDALRAKASPEHLGPFARAENRADERADRTQLLRPRPDRRADAFGGPPRAVRPWRDWREPRFDRPDRQGQHPGDGQWRRGGGRGKSGGPKGGPGPGRWRRGGRLRR
jgi:hypothetical protein